MKFVCEQQNLTRALNIVQKAVSSRTTLPVLKGILIEAKDGRLSLSASDLDLSIRKTIDADIREEGAVVLSSRLFGDIVRKLPNTEILIESAEDGSVVIKTSFSEFKIVGQEKDDFPNIIENESEAEKISVGKAAFCDMIRKTGFAASSDETKGVIVGILTEIDEEGINMVALDGYRMSIARCRAKNDKKRNMIISARLFMEVGKIVADEAKSENIELLTGDKKLIINLENTKIVVRMIDGEYIKYRDILPKDSKCRIKVHRGELSDCIERASLLAKEGKNNLIRIKTGASIMTVSSRSEEGNVREEVQIEREGSDLEIGFNSKYISDVLKSTDDEEIILEMNNNVSPCIIKPVEGNSYEHLVLPVRL